MRHQPSSSIGSGPDGTVASGGGAAADAGVRRRHAAAAALYAMRRRRDELFGRHYFPDPRWDMLLFLYMARNERRRASITGACLASAVPSTTALRHIGLMRADGLLEREPAGFDGRLSWLELSPDAYAKVDSLMERLLAIDAGAEP